MIQLMRKFHLFFILAMVAGMLATGCGGGGGGNNDVAKTDDDNETPIVVEFDVSETGPIDNGTTITVWVKATSANNKKVDARVGWGDGTYSKWSESSNRKISFKHTYNIDNAGSDLIATIKPYARNTLNGQPGNISSPGDHYETVTVKTVQTPPDISAPQLADFWCSVSHVQEGVSFTCDGSMVGISDNDALCSVDMGDGVFKEYENCEKELSYAYRNLLDENEGFRTVKIRAKAIKNGLESGIREVTIRVTKLPVDAPPAPKVANQEKTDYYSAVGSSDNHFKSLVVVNDKDHEVTFTGTAASNCYRGYAVCDGNDVEEFDQLDEYKNWSYKTELGEGWTTCTFYCKSKEGVQGASLLVDKKVDTKPPHVPIFESVTSPTNSNKQTLKGLCALDGKLTIKGIGGKADLKETVIFDATNDDKPDVYDEWSFEVEFLAGEGTYEYELVSTDAAGNKSNDTGRGGEAAKPRIKYSTDISDPNDPDPDPNDPDPDPNDPDPDPNDQFSSNVIDAAYDKDGNLWGITTTQLIKYSSTGQQLGEWDLSDILPGSIPAPNPSGLAYCHDKIFFSDTKEDRVYGLHIITGDPTYGLIAGSAVGMKDPLGLTCTGTNGSLYVADSGNDRIYEFSEVNGTPLEAFGNNESSNSNNLDNPVDISYADGKLYVVDQGNDRVLVYDEGNHDLQTRQHTGLSNPTGIASWADGNDTIIAVADNNEVIGLVDNDTSLKETSWTIDENYLDVNDFAPYRLDYGKDWTSLVVVDITNDKIYTLDFSTTQ